MAKRKSRSRKPSYGSAGRLVQIVHGLNTRPYGWRVASIIEQLNISQRTMYRYLNILRSNLTDANGDSLVEVRGEGSPILRLRSNGAAVESTAYQLASLYFALTVFNFLEGTILKDGVLDLWERFVKNLPALWQPKLADFQKKFYAVPFAPKDYREHDEVLDSVVRALIAQNKLRVRYRAATRDAETEHQIEPYTLAMYRGGLYLFGHSSRAKKIIVLAVERIREVEVLGEKFVYPRGYSPEQYTEGAFGIINRPEKKISVELLLDPVTATFLEKRRIHPTQCFEQLPDGRARLTMTVHGTEELCNWILSFGPYMKVVRPASLRKQVRDLHRAAAQ